MTQATLYKNPVDVDAVLTEAGAPFPDAGLLVDVPFSKYYSDLLALGTLLTREEDNGNSTDPLTINVAQVTQHLTIWARLGADTVAREVVWSDGAFRFPYVTGSSRDGAAFSVTRAGGWPAGSTLVAADPLTLQNVAAAGSVTADPYDYVVVDDSAGGAKIITLAAGVDDGDVVAVRRTGSTGGVTIAGTISGGNVTFTTDPETWVGRWDGEQWVVLAHQTVATPVPTSGVEWGAIYTLDLTAQATQTLANGANTIDGLSWYSKGSAGFGDAVVNNVLNGSGLECGSAAFGTTGDYSYRIPWFPFAQIPDYNPDAPVAVAFRFAGSGLSASNYLVAGLASMANDGTQWLSAERATQAFIKYEGAADAFVHSVGAGSLNPVSMSPTSATYGDHAFVEARLVKNVFSSGHAAYAGSLPVDVFAMSDGLNPVLEATARSNLGFFFTRNRSSSFTCHLTHLVVLQPVN